LVLWLTDLNLLDDDATPAIRAGIGRCCEELPSGFTEPVRAWLLVLLDGDTRARTRSSPSSPSPARTPKRANPSAAR
jgi:hypothetical protein